MKTDIPAASGLTVSPAATVSRGGVDSTSRKRRHQMLAAAVLAASVLTGTLVQGYQATRPLPDATFAFRV